jgi:cytochrome c oxidase assembly protein subunit 11
VAVRGGFLAFGFALVPLYNVLCDVTGYGDRSKLRQAASVVEAPDESRTVTIELVSSVPTFGSWEFRPQRAQIEVHPGKLSEAKFYARNLRAQPVTAQAVPSIAPAPGDAVFPQDRMLLLHAAAVRPRSRRASCRCASSSTRSCRPTSTG